MRMKQVPFLAVCLMFLAPVLAAQGGVATADAASSLRVSTLVEAPQSNVD